MIKNLTQNTIISNQELHARTPLSQARGLILRKKHNMIFYLTKPKRIHLHMVGVFYSIDVLFLNQNKQVIEIKRNFKPLHFYSSKTKPKYVIELVYSSTYQINDQLEF